MARRAFFALALAPWACAWLPSSYLSKTRRRPSARRAQQKPPAEDEETLAKPPRSPLDMFKVREEVGLDPLGIPLGPFDTAGLLLEKALDTLEDVALITKRQVSEIAWAVASQAQAQGGDTQAILDRARPAGAGAGASLAHGGALGAWQDAADARPRLLVLGTGWAAHALVKVIDSDKYRVLVVSPRNFFVFTPMLAASSVGTVEYRSITEPIRASNPTVSLLEGAATHIDPVRQMVTVQPRLGAPLAWAKAAPQTSAAGALQQPATPAGPRAGDGSGDGSTSDGGNGGDGNGGSGTGPGVAPVDLAYDTLVYACGVQASGFGVPGVKEHCYFLKEVDDARAIRRACGDALERALAPSVSEDCRRAALTFVVVGGGPTGVEFAGELTDFLKDTVRRFYPSLEGLFRVVLVHGGAQVLPQFDAELRALAQASLIARGVEVQTGTRAVAVRDGSVDLAAKQSSGGTAEAARGGGCTTTVACGMVVWTGGTEARPLTAQLLQTLADASPGAGWSCEPGKIPTDPYLRVAGAALKPGSLLAIGDAAAIVDGASSRSSSSSSSSSSSGTRGDMNFMAFALGNGAAAGNGNGNGEGAPVQRRPKRAALPQTAQVAAQQGAYVARLLNRGYNLTAAPAPQFAAAHANPLLPLVRGGQAQPFKFLNLGLLAYLGGGEAISQVQVGDQRLFAEAGSVGFLLWRSVYLAKQVAIRNRVLVLFDWAKSKFFGRDVTRL